MNWQDVAAVTTVLTAMSGAAFGAARWLRKHPEAINKVSGLPAHIRSSLANSTFYALAFLRAQIDLALRRPDQLFQNANRVFDRAYKSKKELLDPKQKSQKELVRQKELARYQLALAQAYFGQLKIDDRALKTDDYVADLLLGAADGLWYRRELDDAIALLESRTFYDARIRPQWEFLTKRKKASVLVPRHAPLVLAITDAVLSEHPGFRWDAGLDDIVEYYKKRDASRVKDLDFLRLKALCKVARHVRTYDHLVVVLSATAVLISLVENKTPPRRA